MSDFRDNNKRIAKNTLLLYARMILSMLVGLYTSRVVLRVLGVDDYGIYGLVGGMVGLFTFLNSSMAGASSRFITFELGRGDKERLANTFSSSFMVHLVIAGIVFVLAETVGLWLLQQKLQIPKDRMTAAHVVYQLSVLSTMIGLTQVPYNALLIAHERFNVYAYMEILRAVLRLLIVYALQIAPFDKLIFLAFLGFCVCIAFSFIYRIYCRRHFAESKLNLKWRSDYIKPMFSFSVWDLYGNGSLTCSHQGRSFLINMFFGVAYNAAASVATTVSGVASLLYNNVITAYRPVIIKLYARNDLCNMERMMAMAAKLTSVIFGCVAIPLLIDAEYVLKLWLVTPPEHSVAYCQIILATSILGTLNSIQNAAIHATGNVKRLSFLTVSFFLLNVPLVYIAFRLGMASESAFVISGLMMLAVYISDMLIVKYQIPEICIHRQVFCIVRIIITLVIAFACMFLVSRLLPENFLGLVLLVLINVAVVPALSLLLMFKSNERGVAISIVRCKLSQVLHKLKK